MVSLSMHPKSPIPNFRNFFKNNGPREGSPLTGGALIEHLPSCIISEIGHQVAVRDVLHLSLCSRRLRKSFASTLYATVELTTNRQCKATLIALSKQPEHAVHVRRLTIRVNNSEWTIPGEEIDEDLVSGLISRMASSLCGIEAFEWDGLEMPQEELWLSLRTSCRSLKRIGTTVGEEPLLPTSHLFDFDDLRQLSLTAKCPSLEWLAEGMPKAEKLPRRFWAMLIERCPRLEELSLGGPSPSPRIFDIHHVTAGRWPRLHTLSLGDVVIISPNKGEEQSRKDWDAFMGFFTWHRSLRSINLRHAPGSANFPSGFALPSTALPRLESFSGPLKFVKTIPNPKNLCHLSLTSLHHTPSSFPPTLALLRELPYLSSLCIWIDLSFGLGGRIGNTTHAHHSPQQGGFDETHVFKSLLVACGPRLRDLELLCFTRPTFPIKEFSSALTSAPHLRSFVLTKVFKSSDEDMTRCATRIILDNPNIRRFSLRHTHDSWFNPTGGRLKQSATFEVLESNPYQAIYDPDLFQSSRDTILLLATEWGRSGLSCKEHTRSFIHPVSLSKDTGSVRSKESKRSRRRSSLSTSSSGSWSVGSWSWGSAGEQCVTSPRSSISSERGSMKSPVIQEATLRMTNSVLA